MESAGSTSATLGTSLNSSEGEIEKAHVEDTENSENSSLLLLKNPECGVSEMLVPEIQETEVETIPSSAVIQVSPSCVIANDARKMVVPEIQEPLSSCAVKFGDDELDSMNVTKQEEKSEDDGIDSRSLKNREEKIADDIIVSRTVKAHAEFADDAIDSRTVKKQEKFESFGECLLKVQVIDETALIGPPCPRNGKFNNGKRQETQGRKEKRPRRNGAQAAENLESSGTHSQDCGNIGKEGKKRLVYSRKEMEALRFIGLEAQKNKWIEVYCGLGPLVAKEYDELTYHHKNGAPDFDFDPRPQFLKASLPAAYLGDGCSELADSNNFKNVNTVSGNDEHDYSVVEGECSEDEDADEDYSSIQKPAFRVAGEPDFDSGPPQDGLEYLRRVRWEARRLPIVAVAKVIKSQQNKDQTVYMPHIPDIAKCPDNLLPLKQWEDTFLADFSKLRHDLARLTLEGSNAKVSVNLQSTCEEEMLDEISESVISGSFDETVADDANIDAHLPECLDINSPTLSTILKMDSVARVSMLRKRINTVESQSSLSRDDCLWLFALCAAVDCPLDADTCAALRSLLRKCASLRAEKMELDDDVIMLNILTMISGRYFGQLGN